MITEEILEEAKRRYPVGTKIKCLRGWSGTNLKETGIINGIISIEQDVTIYDECSLYNLCIYDNGEWAEIVKKEIPLEPEFIGLPISGEAFKSHLRTESDYDYVNPDHYKKWMHEVWEMEIAIWGKEAFIIHAEMAAFEYRMRAGDKPNQPIEREIQKAQWWIDKANELREK